MENSDEIIAQRAYSLNDALAIGLDEARKNHITPRFQCLNDISQDGQHFSTYLCAANDEQLQLSSLGGASGFSKQAPLKALYESLEKSLSIKLCKNKRFKGIHSFSTSNSPSSSFLLENRLLPKLLLQKTYQHREYPWLELSPLTKGANPMYYPLGLIYSILSQLHPLQKDNLSELSDDTGLAIGATREEAILHGLNQWVERDAYSLFLLKTIINKNPTPARLLLKASLPTRLAQIVTAIEKRFNENLILLDISTDLNIPAFVVSFTKQNIVFQPQGFGASLSKEVALTQALFESIQYKDRLNEHAKAYRKKSLAFYSQCPLLIKAMLGDLNALIDNQLFVKATWEQIYSESLNIHLSAQIEQMTKHLEEQHIHAYTAVLYESDNGVAITYTFIPALENFALIRDAKFFPIKARGQGAIDD